MEWNKISGVLMSLCFLAGCTVVEDRSQCPCLLTLDFSGTDTELISYVDVVLSGETGVIHRASLQPDEFTPEYTVTVPRTDILLNVYYCKDAFVSDVDGLHISHGSDCPRVYMHSSQISAYDEVVKDTVVMHKNHCVMDIVMGENTDFHYELCLKGNVCGYGRDGKPVKGDFEFRPGTVTQNRCQAVLPRQLDSSLTLEIDDGTGVVKKFALGEYMASGGYDWSAADLQDVEVYIDWQMTVISVFVKDWDASQEYEIII